MINFKTKTFKGVKWTSIGTITIAIAALLKLSILARYLDKSDFGLMALVTFIMGFMNLFNDMGITSAILHVQKITKNEYSSLYWLNILLSIVFYVILCLIAPLVSIFYNEPELTILIQLLGLNLLISSIGRIFKTRESKNLEFKQITIFEIIAAFISLLFAIYLAVNNYGVYTLVYSILLQYIIQNILYFIYGISKYGLLLRFKYFETKTFLKIGIYQVGAQIANYFNRDVDILIIGKFFSQDVLGIYSLAKQLVFRPAQILNPIITKVASPRLSMLQNDIEILKSNYLKLVYLISKVNIIIYILVIIFTPLTVKILYGTNFQDMYSIVRILCVYMIFRAIGNPIGSLIIATGKTNLEFYWNLLLLVIVPVFVLIGAQIGIESVAWALTISSCLLFYLSWKLLVYKLIGGTFREYLHAIFTLQYSKK